MSRPVLFSEFELPASCQSIDFVSDTHLQAQHPRTFAAWKLYMQTPGADAIFLLGDLFEIWIGDDILKAPSPLGDFERECAAIIAQRAQSTPVYFMHGNRDFSIGHAMGKAAHMTILPDPTVLNWQRKRIVLTHGDLLCTDDVKYQKFRRIMRNRLFQQIALMVPLKKRLAISRKIRLKSERSKQNSAAYIMDANQSEVQGWFDKTSAHVMIHGHTHRPADHHLPGGYERLVLSDWDLDTEDTQLNRAEVLRWDSVKGIERISLA